MDRKALIAFQTALCQAIGVDPIRTGRIVFTMNPGDMPVAEVMLYIDDGDAVTAVLKRFALSVIDQSEIPLVTGW